MSHATSRSPASGPQPARADLETDVPIRFSGVAKTYKVGFWMTRKVAALHGLDLEVPRGSIYGLLGPNGAGKSTTIKILLNLVRASAGAVSLFGLPPGSVEAVRHVGFVPENPAPYEFLTGREFLTLSGRLAGLSGHALDGRVAEVLGEVDLAGAATLQVRRYSKGMVQRLALAAGILANPRLLILDEPTSGLDPIGRRKIRDIILAQRARGTTVLFCTHIIPDVEALCDRIAILVGGRRLREGDVRELLRDERQEVELVLEGLALEQLAAQGFAPSAAESVGQRLVVRVPEARTPALLRWVLDSPGRVVQLTPVRPGIEDLFLAAVREAGRTVGSEVSG